jgi:hypothetical protein
MAKIITHLDAIFFKPVMKSRLQLDQMIIF